jgi:diguanylate cyclase (GGDEF)-like protein
MQNRKASVKTEQVRRAFFCPACLAHVVSAVVCLCFALYLPASVAAVGALLYIPVFLWRKTRTEFVSRLIRYELCLFALVMTILLGCGSGFFLYALSMLACCLFVQGQNLQSDRWLQLSAFLVLLVVAFTFGLFPNRFSALVPLGDNSCTAFFVVNLLLNCVIVILWSELLFQQTQNAMQKLQNRAKKLEYLATHDALTGLANRRSINELLMLCRAQAERSGVPFTVAMGDIDNFKSFNDTYGHSYGDQILTMLATTIQCATREGDFVCRWGGEEILILFSATHGAAAKSVLQRVQEHITHLGEDQDAFVATSVTMTFGVSEYEVGQTIEGLIQNADEKLYQGKANGKNCVVL